MTQWILEYLRCVAQSYPFSPMVKDNPRVDPSVCHGKLMEVGQKLVCVNCGSQYSFDEGVPHLLGAEAPVSGYGEEEVRQYYEMHFGPHLRGEGAEERLRFPHLKSYENGRSGPPRSYTNSNDSALGQAIEQIFTQLAPTELFYEAISEISERYLPSDAVALDLGCGLGRMTAELVDQGAARVIGMDLSSRMVKEANSLLVLEGEGGRNVSLNLVAGETLPMRIELERRFDNLAFIVGDAERIPLGDEQVSFVLCLNLIDRVRHPRLVVSELTRVLKPNGRLLISDPYHWDSSTPQANRIDDMARLFSGETWQWIDEVDGIPFLVRPNSRRMVLYMSHCIVYEKKAQKLA